MIEWANDSIEEYFLENDPEQKVLNQIYGAMT